MLCLQPIKFSDLDKSCMNINIYVKSLNIPNDSGEIVNFHFSHYKSMENISCHSNQSSYPTGTKNICFLLSPPVDAMCVIWKESATRFQRRSRLKMLTNGPMDARCLKAHL